MESHDYRWVMRDSHRNWHGLRSRNFPGKNMKRSRSPKKTTAPDKRVDRIGLTLSHYKIISKLGDRGEGEVYLAEDTLLHRPAALRFLPPRSAADSRIRSRLEKEVQVARAVSHPNLAAIYEVHQSGQEWYIATEYVDGESLRKKMSAADLSSGSGNSHLAIKKVVDYALQICRGLQQAHRAGLVHRDLKPENILIDGEGRVKILSLGLAGLKSATRAGWAGPGRPPGFYRSPEQAEGKPADYRSDIWSFGALLYEMLAGTPPFAGEDDQAVRQGILHKKPRPLAGLRHDIPPGMSRIAEKCLEKNPADRQHSISEIAEDLETLQRKADKSPAVVFKIKPAPREKTQPLAWKTMAALGGVLLVLVLAMNSHVITDRLGPATPYPNKRILVLPFTNVGEERDTQLLCDGLVATLTGRLMLFEQPGGSFWVVPAQEVRRNGVTTVAEAHKNYGVNLVVMGSLQQIENRICLTINLVDAEKYRQLQSMVVTEKAQDIGDFQEETTEKLIEMLDVHLPPQKRHLVEAGTTKVAGAYAEYLRARGSLIGYDSPEKLEQAIGFFESALEKDPEYALARAGLGEAYLRKFESTGDRQWASLATDQCREALRINDLLIPAHLALGSIDLGTGNAAAAIRELERVLEIDPKNTEALTRLADAYAAQGKPQEAEARYQEAIREKPDYWMGYHNLGLYYYRKGEYEKAAEQFLQVIRLAPANSTAYTNLGGMYYLVGRLKDARRMFERSLAIQPSYRAFKNLGTLDFQEQRFEDAARMYEKALEFNDLDYRLWSNLAQCYENIPTAKVKARTTLERTVERAEAFLGMNPDNPETLADLGGYYARMKAPVKATPMLEKAVQLAPEDPGVLFKAAEGYEILGNREKSLAVMEKAIEHGYPLRDLQNAQAGSLEKLRGDPRFQALLKKAAETGGT
jgi:serine/threonine protein kinase/tetratricopeptide (TPR) repeat protein